MNPKADAQTKALFAHLHGTFEGLRALNAGSSPAPSFEKSMSMLAYAVSLVEASPPTTSDEQARLTDQLCRLEKVEISTRRALWNEDKI